MQTLDDPPHFKIWPYLISFSFLFLKIFPRCYIPIFDGLVDWTVANVVDDDKTGQRRQVNSCDIVIIPLAPILPVIPLQVGRTIINHNVTDIISLEWVSINERWEDENNVGKVKQVCERKRDCDIWESKLLTTSTSTGTTTGTTKTDAEVTFEKGKLGGEAQAQASH